MSIPDTDFYTALASVRDVQPRRRGVELSVDDERARFDFIRDDILRIKISQGGRFDATPTFAVIQDEFGAVDVDIRETRARIVLTTDALRVVIRRQPFNIDVYRADGSVVFKSVPGEAYRFLNNGWAITRRSRRKDAYLGLGEKTGGLNHNGRHLQMWNTDILAPAADGSVRDRSGAAPDLDPTSDRFDPYYVSIPLYYHLPADQPGQAAASFIDNGYRLHYDMTKGPRMRVIAEGGQYTEYVFAGPDIKDILAGYTALTGRMQPPPLWALGHHQCRWHDYTQQTWQDLAEAYREKDIPCDTLWLDIHYMDAYRVFTWDEDKFPDREKALKSLWDRHFRAITIIDPGVKHDPGYPVFDEGMERNLLCKTESGHVYIGQVWPGRTCFPDFVKEEARRWWGRLNAEHVEGGLAGIWNDMNEPSTGSVPPFSMRFDRDGADHPHERYHNQYALLMAMGTLEGLRTTMPELRTFILSRAGFAGMQRYAANWTGDNCSEWAHLAMSLPMNANLGLSGQPFVGSDVGGFCGTPSPELLIRWYQYGVFQPFLRNHSVVGTPDQYPWAMGKEAETLIRQALEERYRLLPYIYTAFMESSRTGEPIQRPLVYDFQDDDDARDNRTEYMFGPHLLVAPVIEEGQRERTLYLPPGEWIDWRTDDRCTGGKEITVAAPLERCPVFVRAGAVIPTAPVVQSTMLYAPEILTLNLYPPASAGSHTSILHEDDGLTDKHRSGEYLRTLLTLTRENDGTVRLESDVQGEGFPEFQRTQLHLRLHTAAGVKEETTPNSGGPVSREWRHPDGP